MKKITAEYTHWLIELKSKIRTLQIKVVVDTNRFSVSNIKYGRFFYKFNTTAIFHQAVNQLPKTKNDQFLYIQQLVVMVSEKLVKIYSKSFEKLNFRRMMQFAEYFADFSIVSPMETQLNWNHFIEFLSLKFALHKNYYTQ